MLDDVPPDADGFAPDPFVLLLPRIRVQNANAISSPLTWGFPSITAFTGLMSALERRLGRDAGIKFYQVGVVCHAFEAQLTTTGYERAFHLTRNPVLADGSTAAIVEEGRAHLELSLVFDVRLHASRVGEVERQALAQRVADTLAAMRVAGGSVMPSLPNRTRTRSSAALLEPVVDDSDPKARGEQLRRIVRRLLPGYALVLRDDLLRARHKALRAQHADATLLDAWLGLSRLNLRAEPADQGRDPGLPADEVTKATWAPDARPGWLVPIPIGYAALTPLQPAGSVAGARDGGTPMRFVETVWSIGQWISPHRLSDLSELFWYPDSSPDEQGARDLYRCINRYRPPMDEA